jgi:hypothetical protein
MRRMLALVGGVLVAVTLSQFPEYAQQYVQRLGGAVDELRAITLEFDAAAIDAGLSREQAIARFAAMPDTFIQGRGVSIDRIFVRYETLSTSLAAIENASGLERAFRLPQYTDPEIAARTLEVFRPAVPVTPEGFLYAFAGFVLGYLITSGLVRFLMLPFRKRKKVVEVPS